VSRRRWLAEAERAARPAEYRCLHIPVGIAVVAALLCLVIADWRQVAPFLAWLAVVAAVAVAATGCRALARWQAGRAVMCERGCGARAEHVVTPAGRDPQYLCTPHRDEQQAAETAYLEGHLDPEVPPAWWERGQWDPQRARYGARGG
jgi:hypothetical protein